MAEMLGVLEAPKNRSSSILDNRCQMDGKKGHHSLSACAQAHELARCTAMVVPILLSAPTTQWVAFGMSIACPNRDEHVRRLVGCYAGSHFPRHFPQSAKGRLGCAIYIDFRGYIIRTRVA